MKRIESKDNQTFKNIRELRLTRESRDRKQILLEGFRLCGDALESGAAVSKAFVSDMAAGLPAAQCLLDRLPGTTEVFSLPDHLFAALCATENPQGFALVCASPLLDQAGAPPRPDGLYLVAAEIQDPGNLGNMIRTADAFAFDGVLMTAGTVYPFNGKVLRAAMGSCFHVPLVMMPDLQAAADWLSTGVPAVEMIAAFTPENGRPGGSWPSKWPVPAAVVIGNEARGLPEEAGHLCVCSAAIPMPGRAESLNAASAAAILCFELMRARSGKFPGRCPDMK
jgi:RNA methyltransferase, TrmH family